MIAAVLMIVVVIAALVANLFGVAPDLPIFPMLMLSAIFCLFFGLGIYIAAALGTLGLLIGFTYSDRPFWLFMGQISWNSSSSFVLVAVPLFLLMGEILLRADISGRLYRSLSLWLEPVPGGLLHTNIVASGLFSAISGSSVATAASVGSVALPYFRDTQYNQKSVLGSLAAGGALGNLIPPGITFIVYALLTETSVGQLYVAAILPSLLVLSLFLAVIVISEMRAPRPAIHNRPSLRQKLTGLAGIVPIFILIIVVLGSIYGGLATPTESAALGVTGSIALSFFYGRLSLKDLHESVVATVRNTSMIGLILIAAFFLNYILATLSVPQIVAGFIADLPFSPWMIMAIIIVVYIALGTFMEGFSLVITTVPVLFPIVTALGYDPIWFGVMVTMLIEIALITPPDGAVMYVLHGLRRTPGPITDMFVGVLPFTAAYLVAVIILLVFPQIALIMPEIIYG